MKSVVDRNNFLNRTIMEFSFDDDYRYKFDGDHLTIYPYEIPKESDWDRNGRKLSVLHKYWFNRAVIEFVQSDLHNQSFGLPENEEGNRLAYIKTCQVFLQLDEIFGMNPEFELPNGTRMNLFAHSTTSGHSIQSKPTTDSTRSRPRIPGEAGHRFQ
jgi:hypothetical protein